MIASFRHRGLRMLFDDDDRRRLSASHVDKIKRILPGGMKRQTSNTWPYLPLACIR